MSGHANHRQTYIDGWNQACRQLGLQPQPGALQQLLDAHAAPDRHYHGLQHIAECLDWLATCQGQVAWPAELALALCFHDAVYDAQAKNNELRSAQWAVQVLQTAGAKAQAVERVRALIMATCHFQAQHGLPDEDADWMLDIDLAILGADDARFAEYEAQIRAEYAWVPALLYTQKRAAVLRSFLQRPALYQTPHFHALLEKPARRNLRRALGETEE